MSTEEPAGRIAVPVNRITEILNRRPAVAGNAALRLGRFFGTSGKFRFNHRKFHEPRFAERKHGAEIARPSSPDNGNRLHAPGWGAPDRRRKPRRAAAQSVSTAGPRPMPSPLRVAEVPTVSRAG